MPGSITSTVMGWYRYEDIDSDGSDTRNFVWETGPADWTLSFGIRSDTGDGEKHTSVVHKGSPARVATQPACRWFATESGTTLRSSSTRQVRAYSITMTVRLPRMSPFPGCRSRSATVRRSSSLEITEVAMVRATGTDFIDDMAVVNSLTTRNRYRQHFRRNPNRAPTSPGPTSLLTGRLIPICRATVNNNLYAGNRSCRDGIGPDRPLGQRGRRGAAPYVSSVFDVVHDHGGRTAFYAGWNGFNFLDNSWDADSGAVDTIGADDGTDKIDNYVLVTNDDIHGKRQRSSMISQPTQPTTA